MKFRYLIAGFLLLHIPSSIFAMSPCGDQPSRPSFLSLSSVEPTELESVDQSFVTYLSYLDAHKDCYEGLIQSLVPPVDSSGVLLPVGSSEMLAYQNQFDAYALEVEALTQLRNQETQAFNSLISSSTNSD